MIVMVLYGSDLHVYINLYIQMCVGCLSIQIPTYLFVYLCICMYNYVYVFICVCVLIAYQLLPVPLIQSPGRRLRTTRCLELPRCGFGRQRGSLGLFWRSISSSDTRGSAGVSQGVSQGVSRRQGYQMIPGFTARCSKDDAVLVPSARKC